MIKYELAKELKDAGFPQGCLPFYCDMCKKAQHNDEGIDHCNCFFDKDYKYVDVSQTYIPTLSELIEACGDDFGWLKRLEVFNVTWECACNKMPGLKVLEPTPEEAVAKLWLYLNKK